MVLNACRGSFDAGCFTVEPDKDGYENDSLSIGAGSQLADSFNLEARVLSTNGETEFDGSFQNKSETATKVGHVKAEVEANDIWTSSLLFGQSKDESDNFLDDAFASKFDTSRDQLSWQNDIMINEDRLILGVDYTDDEVESDSIFAVSNRDNLGIFSSFNTMLGVHNFDLSLRNDDNEQFGSETTGGIAYGRNIGSQSRMTVSYGTAFKAPTFNELYFPGFGNPDLGGRNLEQR